MNLTWLGLCNLPRNPLNLTWLWATASWNLLRNILRNPVEPELALHQSLPDLLRNLPHLLRNLLQNLLRNPVEPDLAVPQSLPGLLRNPLNLTWLCTKASWNLLRNLLRNLFLEPCSTWPLHQSFPDLLRNRLRNPVEPNLALHQKASRNPVEPDPALHQSLWQALHQSLPDLLRNFLRNLAWLCTRASQTFSGKLRDDLAAPKLPRPSPEPSPEPCWTWPGSAPKPPDLLRNLLRNLLRAFSGTFSGTFFGTLLGLTKAFWNLPRNLLRDLLRTPVEPELALHQSLSDLPPSPSREPSEPSPEPGWTWPGACTSAHQSYSGLKTQLAYAVGEKGNKRLEAKTQTRFDNANE